MTGVKQVDILQCHGLYSYSGVSAFNFHLASARNNYSCPMSRGYACAMIICGSRTLLTASLALSLLCQCAFTTYEQAEPDYICVIRVCVPFCWTV